MFDLILDTDLKVRDKAIIVFSMEYIEDEDDTYVKGIGALNPKLSRIKMLKYL